MTTIITQFPLCTRARPQNKSQQQEQKDTRNKCCNYCKSYVLLASGMFHLIVPRLKIMDRHMISFHPHFIFLCIIEVWAIFFRTLPAIIITLIKVEMIFFVNHSSFSKDNFR